MMTDADLVPLAAAGDVEAFETLYRHYHAFVVNVARKQMRPHEHQLHADVVAEVWSRLRHQRWKLKPKYSTSDGRLFNFLSTLIRYVTFNCREREFPKRLVSLDTPMRSDDGDGDGVRALLYKLTVPSVDPLDVMIEQEQVALLRAALRALPATDQLLIRWRYVDGFSTRDIATLEGCTANNIARRLRKLHEDIALACGERYVSPGPGRGRITRSQTSLARRRRRLNRHKRQAA